MHITIYKEWDLVTVPFPFTDTNKAKARPALVLSNEKFNLQNQHTILAMITTASITKWWNDLAIRDLDSAGLPVESFIRFKIFTMDNRLIKRKIGELTDKDKELCMKGLKNSLAF